MTVMEKPKKELEWKMHTCCNYHCSYCIDQRSAFLKKPDTALARQYAQAIIKHLKEPWMIQILGGEPFYDEKFLIEAAEEFIAHGHWIKIFTNLSASTSMWEQFIKATYGKIYKIKATYHMNQIDFDSFLKTALFIRENIYLDTKFKIFSVVLPGTDNILRLAEAHKRFMEHGLDFDVMPLIDVKTDRYHFYMKEDLDLIYYLFGKNYAHTTTVDCNKGRKCPSGLSYFIINGMDAWACWDAMMKNDKSLCYGSILDASFHLPNQETICPYDQCMCLS